MHLALLTSATWKAGRLKSEDGRRKGEQRKNLLSYAPKFCCVIRMTPPTSPTQHTTQLTVIVIEVPVNLQSQKPSQKMKSNKKVRSLFERTNNAYDTSRVIISSSLITNRRHVLLFYHHNFLSLELRCLHHRRRASRPRCALCHPWAVHPRLNDADTSEQCEYVHKAEQGCWSINEKGLCGWSKWWLVGQVEW